MKAFVVVLLVCYFGAASASGIPNIYDPVKKAAECRHQAYLQVVNCTENGCNNVTSELQSIAKAAADYIDCTTSSTPQLSLRMAPLENSFTGKINCLFNNIVDSVKCIVNGHLTEPVGLPGS